MTTVSCTDNYEYESAVSNATSTQAYLYPEGSTSLSFLPNDEQSFVVKVGRSNASSEATVALSCDNEKFSVPSTVTFAEGETSADVTVTFDIATGSTEDVTISLADENSHEYGKNNLSYSIKRDYTWIKLGKGLFSSAFFGINGASVSIEQAKEEPGRFKLVKPMASDTEDFTSADQLLDYQFVIDPNNEQGGIFKLSETGFSYGSYGMLYFYLVNMTTEENVVTMNMYICYVSGGSLKAGWYETWTIEIPE